MRVPRKCKREFQLPPLNEDFDLDKSRVFDLPEPDDISTSFGEKRIDKFLHDAKAAYSTTEVSGRPIRARMPCTSKWALPRWRRPWV